MLTVASDSLAGVKLAKSLEYKHILDLQHLLLYLLVCIFLKLSLKLGKNLFLLDLYYLNPVYKESFRVQEGIC